MLVLQAPLGMHHSIPLRSEQRLHAALRPDLSVCVIVIEIDRPATGLTPGERHGLAIQGLLVEAGSPLSE